MDFAFSEEQEMLREQARSFMSSKFPHDRVVELADSDEGWDPSTWREIAELGWLGLSAPEDQGGAGMGFLEEAVLFEELGRALYPGPFFTTVALSLPALAGSDTLQGVVAGEGAVTLAWQEPSSRRRLTDLDDLGTKAEGSDGSWTLTGEKHLVPDLAAATHVLVTAAAGDGGGIFLVEKSGGGAAVASTTDTTRRLGVLSLSGTPATLVVEAAKAGEVLREIRRRALAGLALEAVGIAQTALELAINHTKERKQFEKPIGAYQAVSHQVANIYVETELARSLAYWAAWCVALDDEQADVAVAAAKAAAAEAAVTACERSIQVHGGIGFTWEHILHRYYKRAQWIDAFEGTGTDHRKVIAASILS